MAARIPAFLTLCILLCSLHGGVTATKSHKKSLHLTYLIQETRGGPNATVLSAAGTGQGNMSAIGWGTFLVFDHVMKSGTASNSLVLGSITGTGVVVSNGGLAEGRIQINTEHIYKQGSQYNGSSLTVVGTMQTSAAQSYECLIPGGTGLLRGYSGYGLLKHLPDAAVPPVYLSQWDIYITYKN